MKILKVRRGALSSLCVLSWGWSWGVELQRVCCGCFNGSQDIFSFGKGSGWFVVYDIKGLLAALNLFLAWNDWVQKGRFLFITRTLQTSIIVYCTVESCLFSIWWQESTFKVMLKLRPTGTIIHRRKVSLTVRVGLSYDYGLTPWALSWFSAWTFFIPGPRDVCIPYLYFSFEPTNKSNGGSTVSLS